MHKKSNTLMLSLSVFLISSCSSIVNKTLSPPTHTKWVNVEIKNPSPYTKPFPLEVRYISHECLKKRVSGFDGSVITEPSYNVINIPVLQQGNSDTWQGKVAMTGGGSCEWTLSAVNLGIEYINATHIRNDLDPGTAVGATIAFDDDASRNGQFDVVSGNNLNLVPDYFPLIHTNKRIQQVDTLNLFGQEDFLQKKITVNHSGDVNVTLSPTLDESKLVKMVAPERYKVGEGYKIIYPDGTIFSDGSTHPDIKKLLE